MASTPSSSSTLVLEHDPGPDSSPINRDVPISLPAFLQHVRGFKILLVSSFFATLGLEILHVVLGAENHHSRDPHERMWFRSEQAGNIIGLIISAVCIVLYLLSLCRPLSHPIPPSHKIKHLSLHRHFCQITFTLTAISLIVHTAPYIAYVVLTHRAPARDYRPIPYLRSWRTIALTYTLIISGCIRRGPKMKYTPLKLGIGFGINGDADRGRSKGSALTGKASNNADIEIQPEEEGGEEGADSNVLDYEGCSTFDLIFLSYMAPLARKSLSVPVLSHDDLPHMSESIRRAGENDSLSARTGALQLSEDGRPVRRLITRWVLVKALWKGRGSLVMFNLVLESIATTFSYLQVVAMHEIIQSFEEPDKDNRAYANLMCWGLFAGQTVECIVSAYAGVRENYLLHSPIRMSLSSMLFTKILRTTDSKATESHNKTEKEVQQGKGTSQIMNLLTIDAGTIASLATHAWNITNAAIALIIGVFFLYRMFGVSAGIGIAFVPLTIPVSTWMIGKIYECDKAWSRARDARTGAIKELLLSYKVIKLNAFEPYYRDRIQHLRDRELIWQRWRYTLVTLFNILAGQLPVLAIFVTFFFHTKVFGHRLEPASAFVAITVFDRVKASLQFVPQCMLKISQSIVAITRITDFLNQPEVDMSQWNDAENTIRLAHAIVGWPARLEGEQSETGCDGFKLVDVDVTLPSGKFTLVSGPLGSGKTLLLLALLGEATLLRGTVSGPRSSPDSTPLNGQSVKTTWTEENWLLDTIAYAPQQAYIRHGTIRDNIVFGQPMWSDRYKESLRQASLLTDLALLPEGDLTEVGQNGINLSGGQKARINLARCIYSRAKTVYMDDILSAVDAHTATFIVHECLSGVLLLGRTVVLVTHHVGLCLPVADYVVFLKEGRVEKSCPASALKENLLDELLSQQTAETAPPKPTKSPAKILDVREETQVSRHVYKAEHADVGRVATSHYTFVLLAAGGALYWVTLAILMGGTTGSEVLTPLFLRTWTSNSDPADLDRNLLIYFALVCASMILGASRWIWLYGVRNVGFYNRGIRKIHQAMLDSICGAPLSFFEETPTGRIMNVFGQDMTQLDTQLADHFGRSVTLTLHVGSSALLVCFQDPALLIIFFLIGGPLYWLGRVLGKLRSNLRRITAVAGSPLITLYHDAIEGVVMIRAFGSGDQMMAVMQAFINRERQAVCTDWQGECIRYSVRYSAKSAVYNWIKAMIRAITSVFVTATGFILVSKEDTLTGPQVGLILSFAVVASQNLFALLERYSELERLFVSAERISFYAQMEQQEPTDGQIPPEEWPAHGAIEVKNLSVQYAPDLPEVLHDVSFSIEPGMRVGLVGSTGSGKSTMALALFRALEASTGSITIDGLEVEMHELRTRLNMVVQDGTLCSGTLRDALDITGLRDDHEIYEALRRVHLIPDLPTDDGNPFTDLDSFVALEGSNFSHGQRQLLCLARALLKRSRILVMDEATSSVDFEMDAKITATIRECFANTTMLVIAHRLATIMNYDRVLVLDSGRVKEFGPPAQLISDPSSAFHALCMAQGQEEFDKLMRSV